MYDFDLYYPLIKSQTIESRIIHLTDEDSKLLAKGHIMNEELKSQIENAIEELGGKAFFKMRRSPKDAFNKIDTEIYDQWSLYEWNDDKDELRNGAFMKVKTVRQISMLVHYSERIQEDLRKFKKHFIVLRKYEEKLGTEFRCFVCNG